MWSGMLLPYHGIYTSEWNVQEPSLEVLPPLSQNMGFVCLFHEAAAMDFTMET